MPSSLPHLILASQLRKVVDGDPVRVDPRQLYQNRAATVHSAGGSRCYGNRGGHPAAADLRGGPSVLDSAAPDPQE